MRQSPATFWRSGWQSGVLQAVQETRHGECRMQALSLRHEAAIRGEAGCIAVCCKQCKTPEMVQLENKRRRRINHEKNGFEGRQDTT